MAETSVKVDNVYMMFNLSKNKQTSLKEYVIDMVKGNLFFDEFWALENVSFELKEVSLWDLSVLMVPESLLC